jgi:hypothetical protein
MHRFPRQLVLATALANALLLPRPCMATVRPLPERQVRPPAPQSATWRAARLGTHTIYGFIVAIRGSLLTVRLRSGSSVIVDDTVAVAHGDYSAPLFVGKTVSVDGERRGSTFQAIHVYRIEGLSQLPTDR